MLFLIKTIRNKYQLKQYSHVTGMNCRTMQKRFENMFFFYFHRQVSIFVRRHVWTTCLLVMENIEQIISTYAKMSICVCVSDLMKMNIYFKSMFSCEKRNIMETTKVSTVFINRFKKFYSLLLRPSTYNITFLRREHFYPYCLIHFSLFPIILNPKMQKKNCLYFRMYADTISLERKIRSTCGFDFL